MAVVLRNDAKTKIMSILRKQGYAPYARILELFDVYLTDKPGVIGYMEPGKARIVLNKDLSAESVSVVVRHEILHEFLNHAKRRLDWEKRHNKQGPHDIANIAMDYEISNRGYTDADKASARQIVMGDAKLRGLVTEDDYPDWEKATFEEMYDALLKKFEEDEQSIQKQMERSRKLSQKDLDDLQDDVDSMPDNSQQASSNSSANNSQQTDTEDNDRADGEDKSSGNSGADSDTDDTETKGSSAKDMLQDEVDDIQKEFDEIESSNDGPFETEEQKRKKEELAKRVAEIERVLHDPKEMEAVLDSSARAKQKEKAARRALDAERRNASPLTKFKLDLNRFIKNQLEVEETETYARFHRSYEDSEFIVPGYMELESKNIPLINVYHDVSISFSDEAKTAMAMRAIDTLQEYKRRGDIELNVYYFADRVSPTREGAGGGTRGVPIQKHILATKPSNVIIITDGDISDCREVVTVPGAVWMLFYDSRSNNVMEHIRGKKQNNYYDVKYKG